MPVPVKTLVKPTASSAVTPSMKPYVGIANVVPDSRTPRRFIRVMTATMPTVSSTSRPLRLSTAEVRFATPALAETATVRT